MSSGNRRFYHDAKFKLNVIKYAEAHGNRAAGREFTVSEVSIRRWRANKGLIRMCRTNRKSFTGPKKGRHPELEEFVASYVRELRSAGKPVSMRTIQLKAREESTNRNIESFKASEGWCRRFMVRFGFSLRRRTSICQKLPPHFEEKLVAYQRYIITLRKEYSFALHQIGNADETPIYFDMPSNWTVTAKGSKEVKLMSGYEKSRVTVMLAITADGNKLPPYVILKRKTIPKKEVFPKDVIIRAQKEGWMTTELMVDWLNVVWNRRPGALRSPKNMLLLDAFRGHTTEPVKKKLKDINSKMVVIPAGMTSQLQPLDVSVNKPFKDHVRAKYEEWILSDNLPLTKSGKIKKAPAAEMARWISEAWKDVSPGIIQKSFQKCCVTNALDGSEDDLLWEEDSNEHDSSSSSDDDPDDPLSENASDSE